MGIIEFSTYLKQNKLQDIVESVDEIISDDCLKNLSSEELEEVMGYLSSKLDIAGELYSKTHGRSCSYHIDHTPQQ